MSRKNNYWQRRIQEQEEKAYTRTVKQTQGELAKIYSQCAEELQGEIAKVYAKVEAVKAGEQVQINDFYRTKRYNELLDRMNSLLLSLGEEQYQITEPALLELYQRSVEAVDSNIPDSLVRPSFLNTEVVDGRQALFQSWCLDGKNISDRIWEDKRKMLSELSKQLNTCIIQGKGPWESAVKVAERLKVSEENAYRLMRTELAHAQIYAKQERYRELGFTQGKWIAASSCCDECQRNNGQVYALDKLKNMLPAHPNCRCSFSVVV